MKPVPVGVNYTVKRLLLFMGTLVLCSALLGRSLSPIVVLAIATIVSAVLSYFLLARQREQMALSLSGRVKRLNSRLDASAASEDAALDAAEAARRDVP